MLAPAPPTTLLATARPLLERRFCLPCSDNHQALSRRGKKPPKNEAERSARAPDATPEGAADASITGAQPASGVTPSAVRAAGERAIMNTVYRSGGEIVGRFASLLLFAVAARKLGENGLGAFVFGIAFAGFVMILGALGLDRY